MTINAFLSKINILKYMIIYLLMCGGRMFWTFSGAIKSLSSWPTIYELQCVRKHSSKKICLSDSMHANSARVIYLCKRPRSYEIEYCDGHISQSQKVPGRRAAVWYRRRRRWRRREVKKSYCSASLTARRRRRRRRRVTGD